MSKSRPSPPPRARLREVLRRVPRTTARLAGAAGCLLMSGCFSYLPVPVDGVSPQDRVRAQISAEAAERVAPALGEVRQTLDGTVARVDADGVALLVPAAVVRNGLRSESLHQELRLSRSELLGVQLRRLDRVRTGIAAGAMAAAVTAALLVALSGESGSSRGGGPGTGPPETRIPAGFGVR